MLGGDGLTLGQFIALAIPQVTLIVGVWVFTRRR
jgi:hypothetical protein